MSAPIPATLTPEEAAGRTWSVVAVGAGVAGAALAASLADGGRAVLLLDMAALPRAKTCGGTLNPRAVASLRRLGLDPTLAALEPNTIFGVEWRQPSGAAGVVEFDPAAPAAAVSREALDAALTREAISRGAHFLPGARCLSSHLEGAARLLRVRVQGTREVRIAADVVLACDGLGSSLATDAGLTVPVPPGPRGYIGTSIVISCPDYPGVPRDRILMAVGERGYAGAVLVEGGRWNIAAAVRLAALRGSAGPAAIACAILASVGAAVPELTAGERWTATQPGLRRQVTAPCAERLLLVGDAAGYAEPISGEGMAWALHDVESMRRILAQGWTTQAAAHWECEWRRGIRSRRLLVKLAGRTARSPLATGAALAGLRIAPALGRWLGRTLAAEPRAGARP